MAIAALANTRPKGRPGATVKHKNKKVAKPGAAKKNKAKKAATAKNTSTAIVRRAPSPAAIAKIEANAKRSQLAQLRAAGKLQANKKKKKKVKRSKRNGSGGGLSSWLPKMPNPTFRGVTSIIKQGAYGVAGGGASTILAAVMLAILDKVAPTWATHRYAQTVATFVAAIIAVPLILSVRIFNFMGTDGRAAATVGGVTVSLGMAISETTGKNVLGSEFGDSIVGGATGLFQPTGNAAADAAAKAVLARGGTAAQAAAAAAGTMHGLRGGYAPMMRRETNVRPMPPQREAGGIRTTRW